MFNENGHHTARQISNYEWIEEDFVKDATACLVKALQMFSSSKTSKTGEFQVKIKRKIQDHDIHGIAHYITDQNGAIWEFRCTAELNVEHLLYLACYMALKRITRGYLYLILSGQVVAIDMPRDHTPMFLETLMSRFNKKIIGTLLNDIEKFKKQYVEINTPEDDFASLCDPRNLVGLISCPLSF